jgi:hypothetical protein
VKATPGTLQEGGASFATTHWSVVAQSALTDKITLKAHKPRAVSGDKIISAFTRRIFGSADR